MYFIYVMSEQDKKKMLDLGYILVKEDIRNLMYVFQNKDIREFSNKGELSGIKFVMSNTLTF